MSLHADTLVKLMDSSEPRWWSATELQGMLGIDRKAWKDVASDLRNPLSPLFSKLAALGVRYHVEGAGRGARSWLIKETP
jgi:hypothetical protein